MLLDFHLSLSLSCPSFIHSLALGFLEQVFLQDPFLSNKRDFGGLLKEQRVLLFLLHMR
jgi:hypothetical protein